MTARKTLQRTIAFDCDVCGTSTDTDEFEFGKALGVAKSEGWRAVNLNGFWKHVCSNCDSEELEP